MSRWAPTGHTRVAGVIGQPVRHSLSPVIHNAAFRALDLDWAYVAFEVRPEGVAGALAGVRGLGIEGLNVTMPHKAAVVALVDHLDQAAGVLDAVNTIVNRGGVLTGHNTEGDGFLAAIRRDEGFDPAGKRCLVGGAGGAARAVVRALDGAGAAEIVVVNRSADRARAAAAVAVAGTARVGTAEETDGSDLVVNATPIGMGGVTTLDGAPIPPPIDPARLGRGQLVVDLVYDPPITPLIEGARAAGAVATNGLGMLIHQAAHAFRLWTGEEPPLEAMSAAALGELTARRG